MNVKLSKFFNIIYLLNKNKIYLKVLALKDGAMNYIIKNM